MIALLLALSIAHAADEVAPVVEPTPDDEVAPVVEPPAPSPREQARTEAATRQAALEAMIEAAQAGEVLPMTPEVQDDDAE